MLESVWSCLAPGGRFIAYQFRRDMEQMGRQISGEPEIEMELLNLPPLHIYRWQKSGAGVRPHLQGDSSTAVHSSVRSEILP
jgi:hypothetical protein